jgi:hypothetical protein
MTYYSKTKIFVYNNAERCYKCKNPLRWSKWVFEYLITFLIQ